MQSHLALSMILLFVTNLLWATLVKTSSPRVEDEKLYSHTRMSLRFQGRGSKANLCAWVRLGNFLLNTTTDRVI